MSIGTALTHARENDLPVGVLVEGHWLRGHVALVDGFGLVLDGEYTRQAVVRIESIAAVTMGDETPADEPVAPQRSMAVVR
jgi:hypothetical protein